MKSIKYAQKKNPNLIVGKQRKRRRKAKKKEKEEGEEVICSNQAMVPSFNVGPSLRVKAQGGKSQNQVEENGLPMAAKL